MPNDSVPVITLLHHDWDRLKQLAETGYPNEICALLIGRYHLSRFDVTQVETARNVHPEPEQAFEVDPAALLKCHREAREADLELLGAFHTHPDHPAEMSKTDLARAEYAPPVWLISSVTARSAALPNAFVFNKQDRSLTTARLTLT